VVRGIWARVLGLALSTLIPLAPAARADTVGFPIVVRGTVVFFGVACPTATSCFAVGDGGSGEVVLPITDGIPGTPIPVPGAYELRGIACESATSCVAVGSNAANVGIVVPITGTAPGVPITVPGTISVDSISCPSATGCTAVGTAAGTVDGVVVPIAGRVPGSPVFVSPIRLRAIACQTATSCTAVGDNNFPSYAAVVLPITNGTPGAPVTVPGVGAGLDAIACQTASTCTAVGNNESNFGVVVAVVNGMPAPAVKPPRYAAFFGVACESAATCEGVGQTGFTQKGAVVTIVNGQPGLPIAAPGDFAHPSLNAIGCMSATSCEVVGTTGYSGLVVSSCTPAAARGCAALSGRTTSRHSIVQDKVKCVGSSGQRCAVMEQLSTTSGRLVAHRALTIRPGHTITVALKLGRTGKRLLGKRGKLRVTLTISRPGGASPFVILDRRLTLTR
jgi:hypothetical protein